MQKLTIDSSVFISALLPKDRFYDESRNFFEQIKRQEVVIIEPITVVLEICNILVKNDVRGVQAVLDRLLEFHILELDTRILQDAHFVFQKCQLKTADAVVVWCASVSESTLISWDARLLREAKKLTIAQRPSDYIHDVRPTT